MVVRLLALPHWYNPLSWMAAGCFEEAAEWACDDEAKRTTVDGHRDYARALLQLDAIVGLRLSYHAAAPGRGVSLRVHRLLRSHNEKDSLMKRSTILGIALGLALMGLVRLDLVVHEPAVKNYGESPSTSLPRDAKLNAVQRAMWQISEEHLSQFLSPSRWQDLDPQERSVEEEQWLKQLSAPGETARILAIFALTALNSRKPRPGLLQIATHEGKRTIVTDGWLAAALGIVGDLRRSPPPRTSDLSLQSRYAAVGTDLPGAPDRRELRSRRSGVAAVVEKQGGQPQIAEEPVAWATRPETLK